LRYHAPGGSSLWGDETVLESEPPRRLVVTWHSLYDPALAAEEPQPGELGNRAARRRLPQVDHRARPAPGRIQDHPNVAGPGWMMVLSGMKTLLGTGAPLAAGQLADRRR